MCLANIAVGMRALMPLQLQGGQRAIAGAAPGAGAGAGAIAAPVATGDMGATAATAGWSNCATFKFFTRKCTAPTVAMLNTTAASATKTLISFSMILL